MVSVYRYSRAEYKQINDACLEGLMIEYNEADGFDFDAADARAVENITEQRYNPQTGQLDTPFGGYALRKKMEENGPIERIQAQRRAIFREARKTIRSIMQNVRENNQNPSTSAEEEAQRFWETASQIRDLYMLPFRWQKSDPGDRGSAWFEDVRRSELYKAARTQQNIEQYGKEGKELFDWMCNEMEIHSSKADPSVSEVFGEVNGANGHS